MKQETLEEAGEKLYPNRESFLHRFQNIERKAFTEGAKWQQEKMYSDEDVKTAFLDGWELRDGDLPFPKAMKKWFEQFKKK